MAGAEQRTEQAIKGRQVTDYQTSWTEGKRGGPGKFSFQLILDNGAEDSDVLTDMLKQTGTLYFDTERKVLIFGDVSV